MSIYLGLDIGSNSVGSAWVDTERQEVHLAASVFPAGVDEQENKRGAPKNQARRQTRSQRRTIHRRAQRKRQLARFLMDHDLLPREATELQELFDLDPWQLRRKARKRNQTLAGCGTTLPCPAGAKPESETRRWKWKATSRRCAAFRPSRS